MADGFQTVLIMFAINQAVTIALVIGAVIQKRKARKELASLQLEIFELYRKESPRWR